MRILFVALISIIFTAQLSSQEITVFQAFGGLRYYEDDHEISKKQVNKLLSENKASGELWKKAKGQRFGTAAGLIGEVVFFVWTANRAIAYKNPWGTYAGALGFAGVASGFTFNRLRLQREAILAYNESLEEN